MSEWRESVVWWRRLLDAGGGKIRNGRKKVKGGRRQGKGLVAVVLCIGLWGDGLSADDRKIERWECGGIGVAVVAEGDLAKGEGAVVVGGARQSARFGIFGFDRKWWFGDGLKYLFVIGADAVGRYYDFSEAEEGEKVQSSQIFSCALASKKEVKDAIAKAVPAPRRKPKPPPDAFDTLLRDLERQRKKTAGVPSATIPRRQADSSPSPARRLQAGLQQQRLVAALVRQIRERVRPCWNPPIRIKDAHMIQVGIRIALNTDGTLMGRPRIVDQQRLTADPVFRAYAESVVRALQNPRCSPLRLPLDSYSAWRKISFNFDTRELPQ